MNQPRSIYKTDYVCFDWVENNISSESNDFCSSENIDDCIRHISQELSALGYPSIHSSSSNSENGINCDIVTLLNVTFELIGSCKDHAQIKDDLECRNRHLSSDLNLLYKKNAQLKDSIEQLENKYKGALEKERQLKEKNNQLFQSIKNEKEEVKKLSSQIQHQKIFFQHEIRKNETHIDQLKVRLNQIISDRNPDKKVASISTSSLLQRDSKQRGKWKTGTVAKSCVEEMYSSIISSYENRCQEMMKEISDYRGCLGQIQHQIFEIDLYLGGNSQDLANFTPLSALWHGTNWQKTLEDRFQYLLNKLKETALKKVAEGSKSEDETTCLKLKLYEPKSLPEESKSHEKILSDEKNTKDDISNELSSWFKEAGFDTIKEQLETEKEKLKKEKIELSATASVIEKEKEYLAAQKLQVIQLTMQQELPSSQWHQRGNTLSSFSVITPKDGSTFVPSAKELEQCFSAPDDEIQCSTPLWKVGNIVSVEEKRTKSELRIGALKSDLPVETCSTDESKNVSPENTNLPKWALSAMSSSSLPFQTQDLNLICETSIVNSTSNEQLELSSMSLSEQNMDLLKAAMDDIEKRRDHTPR